MSESDDPKLRERVVSLLRSAVRDSEAGRVDLLECLDGLPDCVAWTGADLRYRFVNRALADWYGVARDEIIGRSVPEMCGRETFERLRPHIDRVLAGERVRFELTLSLRGAPERDVVATLVPRTGHDGSVDGWLSLVEDVTGARASGGGSARGR